MSNFTNIVEELEALEIKLEIDKIEQFFRSDEYNQLTGKYPMILWTPQFSEVERFQQIKT